MSTNILTTVRGRGYLRLKERTVYDLVARKAIPCSRVTGKLIFPRRLVDRWLDSHVQMKESGSPLLRRSSAGSSDPLLEWALQGIRVRACQSFRGQHEGLKRFAEARRWQSGCI